jgi:hypothetical protein
MGCRMMFGKIISFVEDASSPLGVKLSLAYAVANPVKAHVNHFGVFLFDRVIGNRLSCYIGRQNRGQSR